MVEYRTPTYPLDLPTFLDLKKKETMIDLKVAKLGVIDSYDSDTDTATVEIKTLFNEKTPSVWEYQKIPNVPVVKSKYFSHPIKKGDGCLLIFLDTDFTWWLDKGQTEVPLSPRLNNLNDAIAIMGVDTIDERASFDKPNSNVVINARDGKVDIKNQTTDLITICQKLITLLTNLNDALDPLSSYGYLPTNLPLDTAALKTEIQKLIEGTLV